MKRRSAKAGFTLIEVIMAIIVFMIALMGLTAMQSASAVGSDMAHKHTAAVNIARYFLTQLQNEISTWPENRVPTGAIFPLNDTPMLAMLGRAENGPDQWHLLPGDMDGDVNADFRLDRYLGHSGNNLEPTSSFCVHYMVHPMDTIGVNIQNALVWRLHVRVAWPKNKQYGNNPTGEDGWMNCDPENFEPGGARLANSDFVELVGIGTRELAQ